MSNNKYILLSQFYLKNTGISYKISDKNDQLNIGFLKPDGKYIDFNDKYGENKELPE